MPLPAATNDSDREPRRHEARMHGRRFALEGPSQPGKANATTNRVGQVGELRELRLVNTHRGAQGRGRSRGFGSIPVGRGGKVANQSRRDRRMTQEAAMATGTGDAVKKRNATDAWKHAWLHKNGNNGNAQSRGHQRWARQTAPDARSAVD
ncbi:hypothetical protein TRVL_03523 [Trypanosoma vivax]|nr:hypothetical protein TRVL_03523 [Trypanosoma vivax]